LQFARVRSGLAEARDHAVVSACDAAGNPLFRAGAVDAPIFYRSAIKPFQASVAVEAGVELPPEHVAVACSSHGGYPVHLTIVGTILRRYGLDPQDLQCPPAWPLGPDAHALALRRGHHGPRSIFHNCSGKHAAMLAACVVAGWPTASYQDPNHPLQRRIIDLITDVTGVGVEPVGVDGCGAPAVRGTVRGLARAFARLTADDRFTPMAVAMGRFPSLVADNVRGDGRLGAWWGGPVKVGAMGVLAISRHGVGIAAKSDAGSGDVAVAAAIGAADQLGLLSPAARDALTEEAAPPVLGGGRPVGALVEGS
jgi:L-asparaginase II